MRAVLGPWAFCQDAHAYPFRKAPSPQLSCEEKRRHPKGPGCEGLDRTWSWVGLSWSPIAARGVPTGGRRCCESFPVTEIDLTFSSTLRAPRSEVWAVRVGTGRGRFRRGRYALGIESLPGLIVPAAFDEFAAAL